MYPRDFGRGQADLSLRCRTFFLECSVTARALCVRGPPPPRYRGLFPPPRYAVRCVGCEYSLPDISGELVPRNTLRAGACVCGLGLRICGVNPKWQALSGVKG